MLTLSFGYKKPQTGDTGSVVFPALEDNFQRLNDHNHEGSNSTRLSPAATLIATVSAPSGSWVATSGGTYRQLVTLPGALKFDEVQISARLSSNGDYVNPTIERFSNTQFYVYTNQPAQNYTMVFTS